MDVWQIQYFIFFVALCLGFVLVPLAIKAAHKYGVIDHPGNRKIHSHAVPKLGGVAIYVAITLAVLISLAILNFEPLGNSLSLKKLVFIFFATLAAGILGLVDDLKNLKPRKKFFWQFVIALLFTVFGFRFEYFHIPGFPMVEMSLWVAVPFTTLWIMAVINGFNFMDGVDGLAAIVTIIALGGLGFIINLVGGPISGMVWPAAIGAMVAFLWFNWRPAKIYLGDTGAYIAGMFVATTLISIGAKGPDFTPCPPYWNKEIRFHILVSTLLVGYPMLEVVLSTFRRAVKKFVMGRSLEWAEKEHIHHRLLKLGLRATGVCQVAIITQLIFVIAALLVMADENARAVFVLAPVVIAFSVVMPYLGFFDFLAPKMLNTLKPHYQIVHHFIGMQRAKMPLASNRDEVLALVHQTAREFGVQEYRMILLPGKDKKGGFDYASKGQDDKQPLLLGFLLPSQKRVEKFRDQVKLPEGKGGAYWVFESHEGEEDLDVEYRVIFSDFMREALEALSRLGTQKDTVETAQVSVASLKAMSGHALRKRRRG